MNGSTWSGADPQPSTEASAASRMMWVEPPLLSSDDGAKGASTPLRPITSRARLHASTPPLTRLHSRAQVAPLMDKRVRIHCPAELHGEYGVVTDFHPNGGFDDRSRDQYTVRLDCGEVLEVRPGDVRAVVQAEPREAAISGSGGGEAGTSKANGANNTRRRRSCMWAWPVTPL